VSSIGGLAGRGGCPGKGGGSEGWPGSGAPDAEGGGAKGGPEDP
jgi:hypothetical protein